MTDRKKPGVLFWATAGLAGMVLYVMSFGPAYWLWNRPECPVWAKNAVDVTYEPLWATCRHCPSWTDDELHLYWHWWSDD